MTTRLARIIARWELPWAVGTVTLYAAALLLVVVLFPGVSNLWVAIFVLVGGFTDAMNTLVSTLRARQDDRDH